MAGLGRLSGSVVERQPSPQGVIPESQNQVPIGLHAWTLLLLRLPMSLPLSVSLVNK